MNGSGITYEDVILAQSREEVEQLNSLVNSCQEEIRRLNNVLNELEKLTISICENCYEDRETERIKKRIKELKESDK